MTIATAPSCHQRARGSSTTTRPIHATAPQVAGGWSRKDSTENAAIPARLPRMSSR